MMRKRTGVALLMAGMIAGLVLTSTFITRTPAASEASERQPVPTFTPTPPASGADYAAAATQAQTDLAQALGRVGRLIGTPKLSDAAWSGDVHAAMARVETAYESLVRLQPPDGWASFHTQLARGAGDCSAAMRVLAWALDVQDRDGVRVVAALLYRCQTGMAEARTLIAASDGAPVP